MSVLRNWGVALWFCGLIPGVVAAAPDDLREECTSDATPYVTWLESNAPAGAAYAEDRIPVEAQQWWFPTGEDQGSTATGQSHGHFHTEACVPYAAVGNDVTTEYTPFHLTFKVHLAGGVPAELQGKMPTNLVVRINEIEFRGRNDSGPDRLVDQFKTAGGGFFFQCQYGEECVLKVRLDDNRRTSLECTQTGTTGTCLGPKVDLFKSTRIPPDKHGFTSNGLKQLRIAAFGEVFRGTTKVARARAILRAPMRLGLTPEPADPEWQTGVTENYLVATEASGWWIKPAIAGAGGYATAKYVNLWPTRALSSAVATSWTLPLEFEPDPCVGSCAVTRMPITGFKVLLDPDIHGGSWGTVLKDVTWGTPKTEAFLVNSGITIPAGLAPGRHKLAVILRQPMKDGQPCGGDCTGTFDVPAEDESTLHGVLMLYFNVK